MARSTLSQLLKLSQAGKIKPEISKPLESLEFGINKISTMVSSLHQIMSGAENESKWQFNNINTLIQTSIYQIKLLTYNSIPIDTFFGDGCNVFCNKDKTMHVIIALLTNAPVRKWYIDRNTIDDIAFNSSAGSAIDIIGMQILPALYDTTYLMGNKITALAYNPSDSMMVSVSGITINGYATIGQNFIGFFKHNSHHNLAYTAGIQLLNYLPVHTLLSNNIFVLGSDTAGNSLTLNNSIFGLYPGIYNRDIEFNHNTVYLRGAASKAGIMTACISDTAGTAPTNLKIYNNILWNSASFNGNTTNHRTFNLSSLLNTSMDFNDYWKDGVTGLGSFDRGTTNLSALTDIKNALIGQNVAAISAAPALVNATGSISTINIAPTGAPLTGSGFYFTYVPTDFYNINRHNPSTIGAIEQSGYVNPVITIQGSGCLANSASNSITIQQVTPLQWFTYLHT